MGNIQRKKLVLSDKGNVNILIALGVVLVCGIFGSTLLMSQQQLIEEESRINKRIKFVEIAEDIGSVLQIARAHAIQNSSCPGAKTAGSGSKTICLQLDSKQNIYCSPRLMRPDGTLFCISQGDVAIVGLTQFVEIKTRPRSSLEWMGKLFFEQALASPINWDQIKLPGYSSMPSVSLPSISQYQDPSFVPSDSNYICSSGATSCVMIRYCPAEFNLSTCAQKNSYGIVQFALYD
jgi:hypothetical protein